MNHFISIFYTPLAKQGGLLTYLIWQNLGLTISKTFNEYILHEVYFKYCPIILFSILNIELLTKTCEEMMNIVF